MTGLFSRLRNMLNISYGQKVFLLATLPLIVAVFLITLVVTAQSRQLAEREIQALETQLIETKRAELKNYLSVAYFNSGRTEEALRLNRQLVREHPDFLFGHLNLAHDYYHKKQYEMIPMVLGEDLELGEFFTHRDCFHLTEVTGYYEIAIMYFCATGNMEAIMPPSNTLICAAEEPKIAGTISLKARLTPACCGAHLGRGSFPILAKKGNWNPNCTTPAINTA